MSRTLVAYFDNHSEAQTAADRLRSAGIAPGQVNIRDSSASGTSTSGVETEHKGFLASLSDLFMPDEDRHTYAEGLRRGGSILTVESEETEFDRVSDILEQSGAVDMDTRETEWRSEGWSGYDSPAGSGMTSTAGGGTMSTAGGSTMSASAAGARAGLATGATASSEDYIPVAEEQMRVGKREVDHGRMRIRSYVVETPVEEHVSLREERLNLDRRPVDRAATSADHLFQDRTIEAEEYGEEAMISKDARVTEEVRLHKDVESRDETIRDTLKHTEVEIDDERSGGTRLTEEERLRRGV